MIRPLRTLALATAALAAVAGPALAHHSFAMFDYSKTVTLKGVIRNFQWSNPHAIIFVYGEPVGGEPKLWSVELTSPSNLVRLGWSKRSLNEGDDVLLDIAPLRDGSPGGGFRKAVLVKTGQVLTASRDQVITAAREGATAR